jgi:DNA-binding CsgD family transcriptional regulator/PAS domain-containing protein
MTPELFEHLIDDIYAAGEDANRWGAVIAALTDLLGGMSGALHAGKVDGSGFTFGSAFRLDTVASAAYADYYYSINPLNDAILRVPVGVATPDHALVAPSDLERTEFFNDYGKRFDMAGSLTMVLERDAHHGACLGVTRPLGSDVFSDSQVAFVQRLVPHIQRALRLNRRIASLQNERATLESALGAMETAVFILDAGGVIVFANAAGEKLLARRDGLRAEHGRLFAESPSARNALAALIGNALAQRGPRGGGVSLPRLRTTRPLFAKLMPIAQKGGPWLSAPEARAVVFVSDPEAATAETVEAAMEAYGLTPAEKKLLNELIAGRSLKEAADSLSITRATSRNRLARIMTKTETHRQSELLRLMLRSSVPARSASSRRPRQGPR